MRKLPGNQNRRPCRRGLSLMETMISIALAGVLMTASMQSLTGAAASRTYQSETTSAELLAQKRLLEAISAGYNGVALMHNEKKFVTLPDQPTMQFETSVQVTFLNVNGVDSTAASGIRQVTVTVKRNGRELGRRVGSVASQTIR